MKERGVTHVELLLLFLGITGLVIIILAITGNLK